jgi:hypothetical protein
MKIAILYSGRILDYDTYYNNLQKYIVKDNDVDFFLSHSKELGEDLTEFINLYKPKLVIDETIDYHGPPPPHYNGMCMFYNRHRIFQAFKTFCQENAVQYDIVMVYRLDVFALSEINFDGMNQLDDNTIYVPNIRYSQGVNDFIAIGNMNSIQKYCDLFAYYQQLLQISGNSSSNELLLKLYLHGIHMKIILFPYNCLLRETIWENGGRTINLTREQIASLLSCQ